MSAVPVLAIDPETGFSIGPSAEVWASLSPEAKAEVTGRLIRELQVHRIEVGPAEGTAHAEAIRGVFDHVRNHLRSGNRGVFLATDLMVQYPSEPGFAPDLIAVLDVPLHHRWSWVVQDEGRGVDLALEVLFNGDRRKDLVRNVRWFAALGIPEHFVFDGGRRSLQGWRLTEPGARTYQPIIPQGGLWRSEVLDAEFSLLDGGLRVFHRGAPVFGSDERLAFLDRLVQQAQINAEEAARRADDAARRAEEEARRAEEEARRAEEDQALAQAALAALRRVLRRQLAQRGWPVSDEANARIEAAVDPERLEQALLAAATAADLGAALGPLAPGGPPAGSGRA